MSEPTRIPGKPGRRARWLALAAALLAAACTPPLEPPAPGGGQASRPHGAKAASYGWPAVPEAPPAVAAPPRIYPPARQAARGVPGYDAVGVASWYGRRYHGRRTASGERFDMRSATAAHPTLPFGSWVQVTNVGNGRSVVLRINDRGPFAKNRIIDVSRRAAEELGFVRDGIARVRVRLVRPAPG